MHRWPWFLLLALSACASPVAPGPYYQPSSARQGVEKDAQVWFPEAGKHGEPPYRIRIGHAPAQYLELSATVDEDNFLLAWRFSCGPARCNATVENRPLLLEDMESGKRMTVDVVRRLLTVSRPPIDASRNLAGTIPPFADVPLDQQRYTVAIPLKHEFDGPLPEQVTIQLPAIQLGDALIPLPELVLKKQETGGKIRGYVPVGTWDYGRTRTFANFSGGNAATKTTGSFAAFVPAVHPWFEQKGEILLAANFMGRDDPYPPFWNKPFVSGEVKVLVMSGKTFRWAGDSATWRLAPGSNDMRVVPLAPNARAAYLSMYSTRVNDAGKFQSVERSSAEDQLYLAEIPKFKPRKVRLFFPPVLLEGKTLVVPPIDFEYRDGSIGMRAIP